MEMFAEHFYVHNDMTVLYLLKRKKLSKETVRC